MRRWSFCRVFVWVGLCLSRDNPALFPFYSRHQATTSANSYSTYMCTPNLLTGDGGSDRVHDLRWGRHHALRGHLRCFRFIVDAKPLLTYTPYLFTGDGGSDRVHDLRWGRRDALRGHLVRCSRHHRTSTARMLIPPPNLLGSTIHPAPPV